MARACNPSYSGGGGRRISWTQEVEVSVSWDCAPALQPGNRTRLRLKKQNKTNKQTKNTHSNIVRNIPKLVTKTGYHEPWRQREWGSRNLGFWWLLNSGSSLWWGHTALCNLLNKVPNLPKLIWVGFLFLAISRALPREKTMWWKKLYRLQET